MCIKNLQSVIIGIIFSFFFIHSFGQKNNTKIIDEGGSGSYSAVAVSEKTLPDFVVYRPVDISMAVESEGKLPVLAWANGGCMNSSINHERVLSELASHGYIIVAIGAIQMTNEDRVHKPTSDDELLKALDWIYEESQNKGGAYFNLINLDKIGIAGQSCGGAQVMRIAGDYRVKTYIMFNSGMGEMTMAGSSAASLQDLNNPVLYVEGGESDIAFKNALMDYDHINHVPIAFANLLEGGHMGTFGEKYGGSFARIAIDWLDWQLKGKDGSNIFLNAELENYPGWTMKAKNF